ncbi:MAG: hypothetical protein ACREXM_17870 [Gammaproteobacteria bacterium]
MRASYKEAWLAVVAALLDVQGYSIEVNTRAAGHAPSHYHRYFTGRR